MNKKIKVIELLSEISKGKNPVFRKHGGIYKNSVGTFIISYFDKKMTHEEIVDFLNSEVEILEDEEEIERLDPNKVYFKDGTELVYELMYSKINELVEKVNELEKNKIDKIRPREEE